MEIEFVCLANSRLQGGRSVAGLWIDGGGWVRMSSRNGLLERKVYAMEGGREVGLLGVVQAQAVGAQPENYLAAGPRPGKLGAWMPSWVINAGNRQGK